MNRRQFLQLGILVPLLPQIAKHQTGNDYGLVFPMVFSENSNKGCTSKVNISNFKADNIFQQLWQDILRFIK